MKKFRKIGSTKFQYEINQEGVLRNVKSKHITKQQKDKDGYMGVTLNAKSISQHNFRVHRLVAEAWCNIPVHLKDYELKDLQVNHINFIRHDNNSSNLEWCTPKENYEYSKDRIISAVIKSNKDSNNIKTRKKSWKKKYDTCPEFKNEILNNLHKVHINDDIQSKRLNTLKTSKKNIDAYSKVFEKRHEEMKISIYCIELDMYFKGALSAAEYISKIIDKCNVKTMRRQISRALTTHTHYAYGYHWLKK